MQLLTHSRMVCAKTCLRKHYYQYELCIRKARTSQPLRMGAAVHKGLEAGNVDDAMAGYKSYPDWCHTEEDREAWEVEGYKVHSLVCNYLDYWQNDAVETIRSEIEFSLPLINPATGAASTAWRLAGKIDKIVKLPDGRLAVMEHKTTGDTLKPDGDFWRRLQLDQQISLYMLAAKALGYDVKTVLYDVIRKPSIRLKQTETPKEYGARLAADISDRPEFYFARQEIPRLQIDLDEFAQELWDQQRNLSDCRLHKRWFRNTAACLHPYRCEYLDVCHAGLNADTLPDGFAVTEQHPELEEVK